MPRAEIKLRPERLAALPPELVKKLHQAVIGLDPERIMVLTNRIMYHDSAVGWQIMLKQSISHAFSRILIISVILVQFPYSTSGSTQTPTSGQPLLDPAKLIFKTVSGDYGSIYNVIQDKDGFLWLSGISGALKYNGYSTETIYSGETISALFQDSEGLIWMITRSQVVAYDKKTDKITRYNPSPTEQYALSGQSFLTFQKTQLFAEDNEGYIWIATRNGLNKFDKRTGRFTVFKSKPADTTTLLDNDVWSVMSARDGSLWVGTATGLQKFNPKTGCVLERYPVNNDNPDALHGKYVQATVEDEIGTIWAGTTEGGLNRLDIKLKTFSHYTSTAPEYSKITSNFIYRLAHFNSAPDLIWIATVGGLSVLNKRL